MKIPTVTGILLIAIPIAFNLVFYLLGKVFEYPDILRKPTDYVLMQFQKGGGRLVALWFAFTFTGILIIPAAILMPFVLAPGNAVYVAATITAGVLAALVQTFGLIRWPFVVPQLARLYTDPNASQATRDAIVVVFQAFHRYAGVAIGEHLGYIFTAVWIILISAGLIRSPMFPPWLGWVGLIPAIGILLGILEESGFKAAGAINAISYVLWSIWLIVTGAFFLILTP
jgi:Domain of unknown function (DUF4386)